MALVNLASVIKQALLLLEKSEVSSGIGLYSYKRNRKVCIINTGDNRYLFSEDGYHVEETIVNREALTQKLRGAIKREFPRSRKVRMYKLSSREEINKQYPTM